MNKIFNFYISYILEMEINFYACFLAPQLPNQPQPALRMLHTIL